MLYYSWSVGPTMIRVINETLQVQPKPTRDNRKKSRIHLDYAATYPNSIICYRARDMVLLIDSDTEYLTMLEVRICYSGHFYLSDCPSPIPIKPNPERNRPIRTYSKMILNVYPQQLRLKHV